jgi:hypothetical protein
MAYKVFETFDVKRPARSLPYWAGVSDRELAQAQAAWDEAHEKDQRFNQASLTSVAEQARKEAFSRRQAREREEHRQATAEAPLIEKARDAFLRSGGSAEEFEASRDAIIAQVRSQIAVDAAVAAVAPQARQRATF